MRFMLFVRVKFSRKKKKIKRPKISLDNLKLHTTKNMAFHPRRREKKSLESDEFKLDYNFKHLKKVDKDVARYSRYDMKLGKKIKERIKESSECRRNCFCVVS